MKKSILNTQKMIFSTFTTYFTVQLTTLNCIHNSWRHGLMGSIAAFQAVGPGSIPVGVRVLYTFLVFTTYIFLKIHNQKLHKSHATQYILCYKNILKELVKKNILNPHK